MGFRNWQEVTESGESFLKKGIEYRTEDNRKILATEIRGQHPISHSIRTQG
jgi:hypothetical protein